MSSLGPLPITLTSLDKLVSMSTVCKNTSKVSEGKSGEVMAPSMRVNSKTSSNTVTEGKSGMMASIMKDSLKMTNVMDTGDLCSTMVSFKKGSGKTIRLSVEID